MPAPENLTIDTPEQIALEFPLANVGSRFLAVALDFVIQVIVGGVLLVILFIAQRFAAWMPRLGGVWLVAAAVAAWFVVTTAYFAFFESMWSGQTPGKRVVGLRVIDGSGRPVSVHAAILRNLVRIIDQIPGPYGVGIFSVMVTARQQRLGDLVAGTVVVYEQAEPVASPLLETAATARYGAHRLDANDILLIESFVRRRADLDSIVRLDTARRIAARMAGKLQMPKVEDDERFLEQLSAEYRAGAYGLR